MREFNERLRIESRGDLTVRLQEYGFWKTLWRRLHGDQGVEVDIEFAPDNENVHEVAVDRAADRDSTWLT